MNTSAACHTSVLENKFAALLLSTIHFPSINFQIRPPSVVSESATSSFSHVLYSRAYVQSFWPKLLLKALFLFSSPDTCSETTRMQKQLHSVDHC